MRRNAAIAVSCLLVGLGAGYGVGLWRGESVARRAGVTGPAGEVAVARSAVLTALKSGSYRSITNKVAENLVIWSRAEPLAALEALADAERVPQRKKWLAFPLTELARQDEGAAASWLRKNLQEPDRHEVASQVVSTLRLDAPRAAVALMMEKDLKVEESVFPFALGSLAKIDPEAAIVSWQKLEVRRSRYVLMQIAEGYVVNNAEAAVRWAASLHGTSHEQDAAEGILCGLIEAQPKKVQEAVGVLGVAHDMLFKAAERMVFRAPEGVVAVLPFLKPDESSEIVKKVVRRVLNDNPDRALALAREKLSLQEGNAALVDAWKSWRGSDPQAASAWAQSVTDPELKVVLRQVEKMDAAKYQPESVLGEQAVMPLEQIDHRQIGRALSNAPEAAARQWIESHPDRVDSELTRLIAMQSAPDDADATIAWAKRLPEELRDSAMHGTASGLVMHGQLERAAEVAELISARDYRTGFCFSLFAVLMQKDQQQAYDWLEKQPLSAEIRENWKVIVRESMAADMVPFFD